MKNDPPLRDKYREMILLGDSIGQGYWDRSGIGWWGRLAQKIGDHHPYLFGFHNASQSGDTVIDCYHRLSSEAHQRGGTHLVISIGINDLIRWQTPDAETSLSLETSKLFWNLTLEKATKGFDKILVVGVGAIVESRYPAGGEGNTPYYRRNAQTVIYNREIAAICEKFGVPRCETFETMLNREELFKDAGHPNSAGHQVIADLVYDAMKLNGWFAK